MENPADQHTAGFDVIIAGFVPFRVVDYLQAVDIGNDNAERFAAFFDLPLQFLFHLVIGGLVFRVCQFIPPGHFVRQGESRQVFPLFADIIVPVFHADDKMAVIGGIGDRHAGKLCFPAVHGHTVIFGQLPTVFQAGDQMVPVKEKPDPFPVFGINEPVRVFSGGCEEIVALRLDLQFAGTLFRGKLRVMRGHTVNVIDHVIMIRKPFGDLGIGDALFPDRLLREPGLDLRVDSLDADDDVLPVSGQDL